MLDKQAEVNLQQFIETRSNMKDTINSMMDFRLEKADLEQREVILSFPVKKWQLNPLGMMHGGLICTMMDISMGCLAYSLSKGYNTPTIELSVNFVRGIAEGETVFVKVKADHAGKRLVQLRGEAILKSNDKVAATAVGTFILSE